MISFIALILAAFTTIAIMYFVVVLLDRKEYFELQIDFCLGKLSKKKSESIVWLKIILIDIVILIVTAFLFIVLYRLFMWSLLNIVPIALTVILIYVILKIAKKL